MSSTNPIPSAEELDREIESFPFPSSPFPSSTTKGLEEAHDLVSQHRQNGGWKAQEWRDAFVLESFLAYRIRETMRDLPRPLIARVLEKVVLYEGGLCRLVDVEAVLAGYPHRFEQTLSLLHAAYWARQLRRNLMC